MIGLGYLMFFVIYIALTAAAAKFVRRFATSRRKAFLFSLATWVLALGIIFWDVIPVYVVHRTLCNKDAGLVVYKTVEQWNAENPGVAERLTSVEADPIRQDGVSTYLLNQRFSLELSRTRHWYMLDRKSNRIRDVQTGEVLAEYIDYLSNLGNPFAGGRKTGLKDYKTWIQIQSCEVVGDRQEQYRFNAYLKNAQELGRGMSQE